MAIYMTSEPYVSNLEGFSIYAEASIGDNGDIWGAPQYDAGTTGPSATNTASYLTWDDDLSDGFDSGWVGVQFHVQLGGSTPIASWAVDGGMDGAVELTSVPTGDISQLQIRTVAQMMGTSFEWSALTVQFLKGGVATETISASLGGQPQASRTSTSSNIESIMTIVPTNSDNTEFTLIGMVSLHADYGVFPDASSLFSQVLVYTHPAT